MIVLIYHVLDLFESSKESNFAEKRPVIWKKEKQSNNKYILTCLLT